MTKYPFCKQMSYKDCGASSLSMIIQYYKGFIHLEKLFEMTHTTKNGTSAYDIVKAAEQLGFKSYGIKCDIDCINVDELILPAIAHVIIDRTYPHFLVIYQINKSKRKILIADPATKIKWMSFDEFNEIFTNKLIILYPIRKIPKEEKITNTYFKKIIFQKKKNILIILLFLILFLFVSFINLYNFTNLLNPNLKGSLLFLSFLLITIRLIVNYFKDKWMLKTNFEITQELTNETYKNILLLPYQYYRNHTTGDIITRLNDIDDVRDFVTTFILVLYNILLVIISGFLLFLISLELFIIALFISISYLFNYLMFNKRLIHKMESLKREKEILNSYMTESIIGFESIKGLNLENKWIKKYQNSNNSYLKHLKEYQNLKIKMDHISEYITDLSLILIIGFGFLFIHKNLLDLKSLVLFYMIYSYFIDPIKNFLELDFVLKNIQLSLKRVLELKLKEKSILKEKEFGTIQFDRSDIILDDKCLLKNVNLEIQQGDKIMLFGHSGSGKSTILKMLKQYYETNHVTVNGKIYNTLDFKNKIVYISQDEYLFTDTLYNNIVLDRKINKKKLDRIIKMCYIDEIIEKNPLGIHMLIEENGFNLSGGEKQRIILARSLVGFFEYLIIDEGLSEIDLNLERRILKHLLKVYEDKTILFVSHRLDNLDLFSKAIKVDKKVEVITKGGV